jgi:uncharacterized damage-inducible protein DinB
VSEHAFLRATIARMRQIKSLGDGVLAQVSAPQLFHRTDDEANSIAVIVQHMHGNMLSRWTDFLTTDGDKPWRKRDAEFEPTAETPERVHQLWEEGWKLTLDTLEALKPGDVMRDITIRGESMTAMDALIRQIGHYGYHTGQMATLARQQVGPAWKTLSIARGKSKDYKPQR